MATYKVIQDIEAEDKLVGPLTLRQFIYAGIVIVIGFINYQLLKVNPVLTIPLLFPMLFFAALAAPLGQDQPSEVWLLAKVRFFLKPRRRIWNQDGISQLVTVTAPKRIERQLTDGLSQTEVRSHLSALASTLDSRGWAVKNVNVNLYGQAGYLTNAQQDDSDRLVSASTLPQDVPATDITAMDDMLDATSSPTAQSLDHMLQQSQQTHKQHIADVMAGKTPPTPPAPQADYWFMNQQQNQTTAGGMATFDHNPLVMPGTQQPMAPAGPQTAAEASLLDKLHTEKTQQAHGHDHMKTILPMSQQPVVQPTPSATAPAKPAPPPNPAIMQLAQNDDLSVATIARQAKKQQGDDGEVVISLH